MSQAETIKLKYNICPISKECPSAGCRGTAAGLAGGRYCPLSLRGGDTIVLTHPVPAVEAALQTLFEVEAAWPEGLQASEQSEEQTTFKLRVNPWTADGHAGAAARELVCAVLETMHAAGWELTLAADLSPRPPRYLLVPRGARDTPTSLSSRRHRPAEHARVRHAPARKHAGARGGRTACSAGRCSGGLAAW